MDIYDAAGSAGGMCNLIPDSRLDKKVLKTDLDFIAALGAVSLKYGRKVPDPAKPGKDYDAVLVTTGLDDPIRLKLPGEEAAVLWPDFLKNPAKYPLKGRRVAVIGGGAVAVDCAETAQAGGAAHIELFALEKLGEMPLTAKELKGLLDYGINVSGRTRVTQITAHSGKITGIKLKVTLPKGKKFHPGR